MLCYLSYPTLCHDTRGVQLAVDRVPEPWTKTSRKKRGVQLSVGSWRWKLKEMMPTWIFLRNYERCVQKRMLDRLLVIETSHYAASRIAVYLLCQSYRSSLASILADRNSQTVTWRAQKYRQWPRRRAKLDSHLSRYRIASRLRRTHATRKTS